MSTDISFEDNNNFKYKSRVILGQAEVPKMTKFLISKGIVKNEKQAQVILFGVTLLSFISSFVLIYLNFFKQPDAPVILPGEQPSMEQPLNNITQ